MNDNNLSVGSTRQRLISLMIYRYIDKKPTGEAIQTLQGYYAYAVHIEIEFHERMCLRYGGNKILEMIRYHADEI